VPTILLAQEDAESREKFSALILDFFPTAKVVPVEAWGDLEPAWAGSAHASVLLTDLWWSEEDRSGDIILLAEQLPEVPCAFFGRYDLTSSLPPGCPIPLLAPDEELPLRLAEIMENLSGRSFGSYEVSTPAGPHALGRRYWAKHQQLQRPVQILAPPPGNAVFSGALRALAQVNHPSVYSLYESVPWENRILVAMEPVVHPSLLHLRLGRQKAGLVACARLAHALGSVLAEMEAASLPARRLGEYDYTLSPKGTPRLRNPAIIPGVAEVSAAENARALAEILEPFLAEEPAGFTLLEVLRTPEISAPDLLRQAGEFERQLAEVREVRVRREEMEAAEKIVRARVLRRWAIALGAVGLAAYLLIFAHTLFQKILRDVPGRLPEAALAIPAGSLILDGETVPVNAFSLDRHEVTIGEYEKFLAALAADPDWARLVPEPYRRQKKSPADLAPRDWDEILRRARRQDVYQDQVISRDTPVFNVDYPSAAAYAAWKGRRLPTLEEWMRAVAGDDGRRFPWGDSAQPAPANLGITRDLAERHDRGDGYFNAAPGESFPQDQGPFGHFDLGGNVSEWAAGPFQKPVAVGGNFTDPAPIPRERARRQDDNRRDPPADSRLEMIGFRTAR